METAYRRCAVCGHEWIVRAGGDPRRCPSEGCRSEKWKGAGVLFQGVMPGDRAKDKGVGRTRLVPFEDL